LRVSFWFSRGCLGCCVLVSFLRGQLVFFFLSCVTVRFLVQLPVRHISANHLLHSPGFLTVPLLHPTVLTISCVLCSSLVGVPLRFLNCAPSCNIAVNSGQAWSLTWSFCWVCFFFVSRPCLSTILFPPLVPLSASFYWFLFSVRLCVVVSWTEAPVLFVISLFFLIFYSLFFFPVHPRSDFDSFSGGASFLFWSLTFFFFLCVTRSFFWYFAFLVF